MKPLRHAIALLLAAFLSGPATAASDSIEVVHPWARPTIPNRPGAVYLGIHNGGDAPDRLVGARAEGVGAIEMHRSEEKDGVMTMSRVEAIEIPARGMAHLGPGGLHLMLFDIESPLKDGESLELTLEFERAGDVAVNAIVTRDAPGHDENGGHDGSMRDN